MSYETAFDGESHTLSRAMQHEYDDAEIPLSHSERLLSIPFDAVPPMERPLAMATRLLTTCTNLSSVRLLCLGKTSEFLFQFRHLVHIWISLPMTTQRAMMVAGRRPHGNRWLSAANGMRPALMNLASRKDNPSLTTSEVASLPDGRKELEPFADWLREDQQVQKRVADSWNSVVGEGGHLDLPIAFSVQMANPLGISSDDRWVYSTQYDYGPC